MLKEQAARWYLNGYNCAECIIHAANEQWQLGMSEADMRMVSGFGGGMQCGDVCGALSAAICVISRMTVRDKAHDCPALQPLVQQMIADVDGMVSSSEKSVRDALDKINRIDIDTLNQAIQNLNDTVEPLANFFGLFP